MIARFTILPPFKFAVREGDDLRPFEFDRDGYHIKIYPPMASMINLSAFESDTGIGTKDAFDQMKPATQQIATEDIKIGGAPTITSNLIQIDFVKDDFDRHIPTPSSSLERDPPIALIFSVLNEFLARLRTIIRGGPIKPLKPDSIWHLRYFDDNEEKLPKTEGFVNGFFSYQIGFSVNPLNAAIWDKANSLSADYIPSPWDTLLLDAIEMLPEVGVALVLANTALETFIATTLERLAELREFPSDLWQWINDRDNDWRKQPSVKEQFDILLKTLAGKSLMEDQNLWTSFLNLRAARNSFVHKGIAKVGKSNKTSVTTDEAIKLIHNAQAIIDWIEELLPEELRRPKNEDQSNLEIVKIMWKT